MVKICKDHHQQSRIQHKTRELTEKLLNFEKFVSDIGVFYPQNLDENICPKNTNLSSLRCFCDWHCWEMIIYQKQTFMGILTFLMFN